MFQRLIDAVTESDMEQIKALVEDQKVPLTDENNRQILHYALQLYVDDLKVGLKSENTIEIIDYLIDQGATTNAFMYELLSKCNHKPSIAPSELFINKVSEASQISMSDLVSTFKDEKIWGPWYKCMDLKALDAFLISNSEATKGLVEAWLVYPLKKIKPPMTLENSVLQMLNVLYVAILNGADDPVESIVSKQKDDEKMLDQLKRVFSKIEYEEVHSYFIDVLPNWVKFKESLSRQSLIVFSNRDPNDWYTLQPQVIGKGTFGKIIVAFDDRKPLFRLKYKVPMDEKISGYFSQSFYVLQTDPSTEEFSKYTTMIDISQYLAHYNYASLLKLHETLYPVFAETLLSSVLNQPLPVSRLTLIVDFLKRGGFDLQEIDTLFVPEEREEVAIKRIGEGIADRLSERQARKSARTEVYAYGKVASTSEIIFFSSDVADNQRPFTIVPPVGCVECFGSSLLVCLLDYFVSDVSSQSFFLVLSLIKGKDLSYFGGGAPSLFIWFVLWEMAHALNRIHSAGIIHNDVKLQNIMYNGTGMTLLDFGLSCHVQQGTQKAGALDSCDSMGGTVYYGTVELVRLGRRYPTSDIWALGVVLWELAVGKKYEVPGQTAKEAQKNIGMGSKPDVREIPQNFAHRREFVSILSLIFNLDAAKRPSAAKLIGFVDYTFKDDVGSTVDIEIGKWLQVESVKSMRVRYPSGIPIPKIQFSDEVLSESLVVDIQQSKKGKRSGRISIDKDSPKKKKDGF